MALTLVIKREAVVASLDLLAAFLPVFSEKALNSESSFCALSVFLTQLFSHEEILQGLTPSSGKAMSQVERTSVGCVFIQLVVHVVAHLIFFETPSPVCAHVSVLANGCKEMAQC